MDKLDVMKIREDFPMFKNNPTMNNHPMVYLDNGATSFKPQCVIDAITYYYTHETSNTHRGEYRLATNVDEKYENARHIVAQFINAEDIEVCFTSGTSMSLNMIAYGLADLLKESDEILLTEAEHASNVLPWFNIAKRNGFVVKYIPLTRDGRLTIENLEKTITPKTKVVSVAHITNVLGYTVDMKEVSKVCHKHGIYVVCDGAQSVPHVKVDVKELDVDFLAFSGHKMCGPTGIGVLYGKYELLNKMNPLLSGGEMTSRFDTCGNIVYSMVPYKFEAGTQNIAGAIGLGEACKYIQSIGFDKIREHEKELRKYAISLLEKIPEVIIYNKDADNGLITFNIKGINPQDLATYMSSQGVCVRSGQHCAKILLDFLDTESTCRASLYFYNTKEDIDRFIDCCKNWRNFLDAFFL